MTEAVADRARLRQVERAERLLGERELDGAVAAYQLAEAMGADADGCSAGRWMGSMLRGDFEGAWRESDAIRRRGGVDPHRFWMGEELAGRRVMLRCLHGLGDAIQFLRFVPRLRAMGAAEVIVEVPPKLMALARCLDGVDEVISWGECAPARAPAWEVQVEVMELPYLLRVGMADLPGAVGYLRVPERCASAAAERMGPRTGLRVGVVWAAGEWNQERSLPAEGLEVLLGVKGVTFWNLQGGEASAWKGRAAMREAAVCGEGLLALSATVAKLDLVITVDTMAAHMAGAMGVPVWVLLQREADWRWMHGREDSPWYPTMRLFRQTERGDWMGLVERVRRELAGMVGGGVERG